MADLLPSIPDTSVPEEGEPRVVGLDEEEADAVFGALSSETARELFAALNDDPAHPSALADAVDTSLQNAQYHLEKLEDAGLVEVVDTAYSEKGREMDIYAPADRPLVVFAGDDDEQSLLESALGRLLGGWGVLLGLAIALQGLLGRSLGLRDAFAFGSGDAGYAGDDAAAQGDSTELDGAEPTTVGGDVDASGDNGAFSRQVGDQSADGAPEPAVQAVDTIADDLAWLGDAVAAGGVEPGLAVLALGGAALTVAVGAWYYRMRQTTV